MRSFGFFGALLILVIAVVAGMIGYNMGIAWSRRRKIRRAERE